jgi:predicted amino acid racemase
MNTEFETIKLLSDEAQKQHKVHKIIIMIELGELREGIMRDDLIDFYSSVFKLKNIEVVGIGTNLSCLYGVLPSHDKLIQLSLFKQLIEAKFSTKIDYVSGGSSVTIPLIFQNLLPKGINHFRVGESLFLGTDVYNNTRLKKMETDVFKLSAEIIELIEKPKLPDGELGTNMEGHTTTFDKELSGETSYRAIIDIGLLDVDDRHIIPIDRKCFIVGGSSDMFVIDLSENKKNYKVGDLLEFKLDYMGILRILNSKYIEKRII